MEQTCEVAVTDLLDQGWRKTGVSKEVFDARIIGDAVQAGRQAVDPVEIAAKPHAILASHVDGVSDMIDQQ